MRHLLFAILAIACGSAMAAAPNPLPWDTDYLSWKQPIGCSGAAAGDTSLANCLITGYELAYAPSQASTTWTQIATLTGTTMEFTRNGVPLGTNCYRYIAISAGGRSDPAYACTTTVKPQVPPGPPVPLTIDTVAYRLDMGYSNQIKVARIGTVPLAKACVPTMAAMGLNVLKDRNWVTLDAGKARPLTTLAKCG